MMNRNSLIISIGIIFISLFGATDFAFAGWTSGKFGSAINFDGINDYVNSNSSVSAASAFSYSLWFKSSDGSFAADEYLFSQGTNDPSVYLESTDNKVKVMADGADKISSVKTVNNAQWRHLEITADGTNLKLYLDGSLESSTAYTGSSAAGILYVASNATPGSYFGGIIDDVRVYNYARTQDEILSDYNSGKAAHLGKDSQRDDGLVGYWNMEEGKGQTISDRSGNGNNGTLGANTSVGKDDPVFTSGYSSAGSGGTGLKFDGKDDYILAPITESFLFGTGNNWTVSTWIKAPASGLNGNIMRVDSSAGGRDLWLFRKSGTNTLQLQFGDTSGTLHSSISTTIIADNNYHFVVGVVNASLDKVYLYIDGKLDNEATDISTTWDSSNNPDELCIGCYYNNGAPIEYFKGLIDEVRIYNRALSADEIRQLYNQKKPILEMKFDEGSGQIAYDGSFNNNDGTIYGATGTAEAGAANTLTDNNKSWTTNEWAGETIEITGGTGSGQTRTVSSNTATIITVSSNWTTNPDATSVYRITSKDEWTTGKFGSALDFDGTDDKVSFTSTNYGTVHSVSFWLNYKDTGDGVVIGGAAGYYASYIGSPLATGIIWYSAGAGYNAGVIHGGFTSGIYYHITIVRNGTSVSFYKNGVQLGTTQTLASNLNLTLSTLGSYDSGAFPTIMALD
ncbi:MAG: LamG domain-containing protein, partial [Minisyncoccia bacterium]